MGPCIQDKLLQKITKDTPTKIKQSSSELRNSCVENRQLHQFGSNIHKLCYRSKAESASGLDLKSSWLELQKGTVGHLMRWHFYFQQIFYKQQFLLISKPLKFMDIGHHLMFSVHKHIFLQFIALNDPSPTKRSVNFEMSFCWLQFLPKNERKQVAL